MRRWTTRAREPSNAHRSAPSRCTRAPARARRRRADFDASRLSRAVASSVRASSSLDDVTLETRGRARGKYMTRARATRSGRRRRRRRRRRRGAGRWRVMWIYRRVVTHDSRGTRVPRCRDDAAPVTRARASRRRRGRGERVGERRRRVEARPGASRARVTARARTDRGGGAARRSHLDGVDIMAARAGARPRR